MGYNPALLKYIMFKENITITELANHLEMKTDTLNRRLRGEVDFKITEAKETTDYINKKIGSNLTIEDTFFSEPVPKTGTDE